MSVEDALFVAMQPALRRRGAERQRGPEASSIESLVSAVIDEFRRHVVLPADVAPLRARLGAALERRADPRFARRRPPS